MLYLPIWLSTFEISPKFLLILFLKKIIQYYIILLVCIFKIVLVGPSSVYIFTGANALLESFSFFFTALCHCWPSLYHYAHMFLFYLPSNLKVNFWLPLKWFMMRNSIYLATPNSAVFNKEHTSEPEGEEDVVSVSIGVYSKALFIL